MTGRICLLGAAILFFAAPAGAEIASPWDEALSSRARLVAGEISAKGPEGSGGEDDALYLGIEVRIDPGSKTYWRNPGDSGIPPRFDWSKSANLKSAEVLFPAPRRIADPAGHTIGYKNMVLFPVRVSAEDKGRPVDVRLKFSYAVCGTLCVPAEANLGLTIPASGKTAGNSARIERELAKVPRRAGEKGAASHDDVPSVRAVRVEKTGTREDLLVTVAQAADTPASDLFLEGPREWYLPLPEMVARRPRGDVEEIDYRIALDALPPSASLSGVALKLTVVGATGSLEQDWTLR